MFRRLIMEIGDNFHRPLDTLTNILLSGQLYNIKSSKQSKRSMVQPNLTILA